MRALLLDLDDTLFDRGRAFAAWLAVTAQRQLGRALTRDEVATIDALDGAGHAPRDAFAAGLREAVGLQVDAERFPHELASHVEAEPGVAGALHALGAHLRLAIASNGGAAQRTKLERLGLAPLVHAVFISAELGVAKPERAFFERALRWAECAADEVLVVGDQPMIDLVPARALGMRTAWLRRRDARWPADLAPPDYQLARIAALPLLLGVCA